MVKYSRELDNPTKSCKIVAPTLEFILRSLLNEVEHGFRKARRPIYYDEGLEWTLTLNKKIGQLNAAIDNVSSRLRRGLRGGNKAPAIPVENDPEVEATL
ncbi:hypothetical protein K1719_021712 [Acacia pycnantha]|nr:hypothetical protein K1719_021712 [Acacia pycnantha]